MLRVIYLLIFFNLFLTLSCSGEQNNTFIPTKEWQTIKEGQQVPAGLHYRINLQTGEKEAKILEDDETDKKSSLSILSSENDDGNKSVKENPTLEEALQNIPSESFEYSPEQIAEIKSKFKSYDDIKKQLKDVNMDIKTDSEIMAKQIGRYEELSKSSISNQSEIVPLFEDLEYLVHQYDNALQFINFNGIEKLIIPNMINQTNSLLRTKALQLLGSLTQNNPKAQISVFEKNLGEHLTRFLAVAKLDDEISAGIFALGSLIRKFPLAQSEILPKSGLTVLFDIWTRQIELKVKVKVLTLITDLVREHKEAIRQHAQENSNKSKEKVRQYNLVDIENLLQQFDYCENVENFFTGSKAELIKSVELAEKVILALDLTKNLCYEPWSENSDVRHVILVLKNRFTWLASQQQSERQQQGSTTGDGDDDEGEDEFLTDLIQNLDRLTDELFNNHSIEQEDQIKDEL